MLTKQSAVKAIEDNKDQFRCDFAEWISANWPIYEEFESEAFRVAQVRDHYAARTIVEVIRHWTTLREEGHFKINNNRIPDMARLFSMLHPEKAGFFKLRESDMRRDNELLFSLEAA